jgi:pilus assembly protein CpaE
MITSVLTDRAELLDWCRSASAGDGDDGGRLEVRRQPWQPDGDPLTAERLAKELAADGSEIVVVGHDVPTPLALELAAVLDRDNPSVSTIIVALSSPGLWRDAMRAGVRDLVEPSAVGHELVPALHRAVERAGRQVQEVGRPLPPPTVALGKVIVVVAPKGGCGKTTVASNLAAALAAAHPGQVVAVDLDAQFGDLAVAFGLRPERTLAELCQAVTLDATTIKLHLTAYEPGLFVLCGSNAPEDGDLVKESHVATIVKTLARDFRFVVIDTPAGLDERTIAAVDQASFDVSSLRSLRKGIDTLDKLGVVEPRRHLILNRADSKVGLNVEDVEAVTGMPVETAIPSTRAVPLSMNLGAPLASTDPGSPVGREIAKLVRLLAPGEEPTTEHHHRWRRGR